MRRVLVARLDSLGDVLLAGPAIRAVARGARVTLMCSTQGTPAARMLPGVAEVIVWNSPWIVSPPPAVVAKDLELLERSLRSIGFDEAIILTSSDQSPLPLAQILKLSGVPRVTAASVDYAGSLLDVRLRPGEDLAEDQPESERALAIVAAAGYLPGPDDHRGLAVTRPPDPSRWVGDGHYVVVHPGASVPANTWPAHHHAELVGRLAAAGHRVVVTGGPGETALTAHVAGSVALDLGGRISLPELAGVLARGDVLVAGNTGPAHLAAAVGTPVVSLFSPVVPAIRWAPHGVPTILLGDQDAACSDTRSRECPVTGHPCLSQVGPVDALAAVERLVPPRPVAAPPPVLVGGAS